MIEGFDIFCVSSMDWESVWGSRQAYMDILRQKNRVFFIQSQYGPEHILKHPQLFVKIFRYFFKRVKNIKKNLWIIEPPMQLPCNLLSKRINSMNQKLSLRYWKRIKKEMGLNNILLWIYNPYFPDILGGLDEKLSLYFCIDAFSILSRGRKKNTIDILEEKQIKNVDVNIVITKKLYEDKSGIRSDINLVYNGCDYEGIRKVFESDKSVPFPLMQIPHPILGHIGSINGKLDLSLIYLLASRNPGWQFVFVGEIFYADISAFLFNQLKMLPNIHFIGRVPREKISYYEKYFDICLNVYKINSWTVYVKPLKVFEYLATGKPIISTPLPELDEFKDVILFSNNVDEFEKNINGCLSGVLKIDTMRQLDHARRYSWQSRVETVSRIINDAILKKEK